MTREPRLSIADRNTALALIGRIYDGALNPQAWPTIANDVIAFAGGSKGVLYTPFVGPAQGGFVFPFRIPESAVTRRFAQYAGEDLWTNAGLEKGVYREGNVVLDKDLVPEQVFLRSSFYLDFMKSQGIARLCVGIVFGQESPGVIPTVCSAMRDVHEPRFGEVERERMQVLVPHLARALGVMFRLRDTELRHAATLAALDRLSSGVILLDSRGYVIHANRAAQRSLREGDGLAIRSTRTGDRHLTAGDGRTQASIEAALKDCLAPNALDVPHFSRGVAVPRPSGSRDIVLQFAPLPGGTGLRSADSEARAIVFLTDPESPLPLDSGLLKKLFGLTPAETRLAAELASGATVETAAAGIGVSMNTARSQLKRIFTKTGTHRQADLVRLLVSLSSTN